MIPILHKNLTCLFTNNAPCLRIRCSVTLRLFSTSEEGDLVNSTAIFDLLLHKHQVSPEVASKAASVLNRVKDPGQCDSVLSFLKESGFSNAQLERIVKYRPQYLLCSLEDSIKPKVRIFRDLGFGSDDIAEIMSRNPAILQRNFHTRLIPSFSVLKDLLGTNDAVIKLLRRLGWFLLCDVERSMVPNIEFLKSCGIPMERIIRLLFNYPKCLLLNPEIIRKSVRKAEEMGAERSSNMFIYAIQVCSLSDKAWELKLQAFRDCGFSESDIVTMFRKAPLMFGASVEKLMRAKDILLATGKYDLSCIVNNPISLACSIEKRYNPRFQILEILERKNLIKEWPTLGRVYQMSDKEFSKKFVGPYVSEVGKVYIAKSSTLGQRIKRT